MTKLAKPLSPYERRNDLTDRECTSIIGATIGGLSDMASKEDLRNAIHWWADNFDKLYETFPRSWKEQ